VIWIDHMIDWAGTTVIRGLAAELIDPENLKLASQELVLGSGVHLVLHPWASMPIGEDGAVPRRDLRQQGGAARDLRR
jgi:hypothetical protein